MVSSIFVGNSQEAVLQDFLKIKLNYSNGTESVHGKFRDLSKSFTTPVSREVDSGFKFFKL